jgi:hypothetical protein
MRTLLKQKLVEVRLGFLLPFFLLFALWSNFTIANASPLQLKEFVPVTVQAARQANYGVDPVDLSFAPIEEAIIGDIRKDAAAEDENAAPELQATPTPAAGASATPTSGTGAASPTPGAPTATPLLGSPTLPAVLPTVPLIQTVVPVVPTVVAPVINTVVAPIINTAVAPIVNTAVAPIINTLVPTLPPVVKPIITLLPVCVLGICTSH